MTGFFGNRRSFIALALAAIVLAGCASRFGTGDDTGTGSVPPPVKGNAARFAFTPIDGAPVAVLQALSTSLNRQARAQGLNVVPISDPSRTYEVRGFLSAVADGAATKMVYVWDVVDLSGRRLHRITGQEAGGRPSSADPWTGIGFQTVELAAQQTVTALRKWVDS